MVYVNKAFTNGTIELLEIKTTDRTRESIMLETGLSCCSISFIYSRIYFPNLPFNESFTF